MNSGLMTVHHNDPEICIDDPEYFSNIAADTKLDTRAKHYIQIPPKLAQHNWMYYQTLTCSSTSQFSLA